MRYRLMLVAGVTAFLGPLLLVSPAKAQVPPTHGELIDGGATVSADYNVFDEGSGPPAVAPRGRNTSRDCWIEYSSSGLSAGRTTLGELQAAYENSGNPIPVSYVCEDIGGGNPTARGGTWPPNGNTGFLVPPTDLRDQALEAIWFPSPIGGATPTLGEGSVAQLDTFFFVGNWAPVSAMAQAGPIWARVTATPVSQHWEIEDNYRGLRYEVDCSGGGVSFDPASGLEPPQGVCRWEKPPHSSAGQTTQSDLSGSAQGQPCFPATVTIQWAVSWTTNAPGVPGGDLEPGGESAASTCIVVKEIQAVVTGDDPGD